MAVKTPVTPTSRIRIRKKYSLTLCLRFQEERTATKNSKVESSIRGRLMPSTPMWYCAPNAEIQLYFSSSWKPPEMVPLPMPT